MNNNHSIFKCQICGGDSVSISFNEQKNEIRKMIDNSSEKSNDFDSELQCFESLMVPVVCPFGMIRCSDCGKVQNISYNMIGKELYKVESMGGGAIPSYK